MTNALEKVQREVDIMRQIWHPNVVPLFGVLDDPNDDSLYLGMTPHTTITLTVIDDVVVVVVVVVLLVLELEEKGQIMDWDGRTLQYKSRHFPLSTLTGGISEDQLRPLVVGMTNGLAGCKYPPFPMHLSALRIYLTPSHYH
jgi:serine/threonine protein kinase